MISEAVVFELFVQFFLDYCQELVSVHTSSPGGHEPSSPSTWGAKTTTSSHRWITLPSELSLSTVEPSTSI